MAARVASALTRTFGDLRGPALFVVLGCLLCQLGLGFGYAIKPLAGKIIDDFSWTRAEYFWVQSPLSVVYALGSLLVGFLVIRFGAKRILVSSVLLLSLVFALYSQMQTLQHMFGLVILMGLAQAGLGDITVGQLVSQWVRRGRGLALGIVYTGSNLGGYIFIPLAVQVAEQGSWRDAFLGLSGIAIVVLLPASLFLVRAAPAAGDVAETDAEEAAGSGREEDLDLKAALRTRTFWLLALSLFCFFFYFMGVVDHLVLHLTDEGLELADAGFYLKQALGLGIASKIGLGLVADRIPHRSSILLVFLGMTASSLVLFTIPGGEAPKWAFIVTFGVSAAARDVVYPLIVTECFGLRYMAQIYGGLMLAFLPAATLGPVFAAEVRSRLESYEPAFVVFVALNVIAVVGLLFVRNERERPPPLGSDSLRDIDESLV